MSILDYPEYICPNCKKDTWFYRGGEWVCGICHSPGGDTLIKMRIIKGNHLLNEHHMQMSVEQIEETIGRIRELWKELGKTDCLYIEGGKKLKKCIPLYHNEWGNACFTCPNEYWWQTELDDELKKREKKRRIQEKKQERESAPHQTILI